jgi:endogenous inhibitor of DNA gyrase (YacG/DUF329 family)
MTSSIEQYRDLEFFNLLSKMRYKCPICQKPVKKSGQNRKFFPFCSKRCSLIDLGAWLDSDYKIITKISDQPSEEKKKGK